MLFNFPTSFKNSRRLPIFDGSRDLNSDQRRAALIDLFWSYLYETMDHDVTGQPPLKRTRLSVGTQDQATTELGTCPGTFNESFNLASEQLSSVWPAWDDNPIDSDFSNLANNAPDGFFSPESSLSTTNLGIPNCIGTINYGISDWTFPDSGQPTPAAANTWFLDEQDWNPQSASHLQCAEDATNGDVFMLDAPSVPVALPPFEPSLGGHSSHHQVTVSRDDQKGRPDMGYDKMTGQSISTPESAQENESRDWSLSAPKSDTSAEDEKIPNVCFGMVSCYYMCTLLNPS